MIIKEPLEKYIEELAGRQPTPGGGSASAVCGSLGVALLEMVCNFTIGNKKYKDFEDDIKKYLFSLQRLRLEFSKLIDEDVLIYDSIRSAFKTKDKKNIDNVLKDGYYISLNICKLSNDGMEIALELSNKGNVNLITDVGCGVELLNGTFNCGIFNAEINLKGIGDIEFREKEKRGLMALRKEIEELYKETINKVKNQK